MNLLRDGRTLRDARRAYARSVRGPDRLVRRRGGGFTARKDAGGAYTGPPRLFIAGSAPTGEREEDGFRDEDDF